MSAEKADENARRRPLPRHFHNELRNMMYGFGDNANPRPESVKLMEEIVLDYISCLAIKSTEIAHQYRRERPEVSDIKVIIRKDTAKLNRVRYLLEMKQEIRKATALMEEDNADPSANVS